MALKFQKSLRPDIHRGEPKLAVVVVFTAVDATVEALKRASALVGSLEARISLVVPHIVPYPLPMDTPPIPIDFIEKQIYDRLQNSAVEVQVYVYLCRDQMSALTMMLQPNSLVIVGGRKRWWPTAASRLADKLRRAGHDVIFAETE